MATQLGQAYVQIMPSAKGIKGSIQKQLDPKSTSAGKSAGSKIATAIKGVITVAAIGKFIGSSLTAGGDLQQSLGGVETLFKDNADKVKKYANEAYKTAGLSANAYMENVTGFSASLLQSLGGDTEKAAEKSNMAMVDMADNSNKMGTSMESIQNAYQGFAKQNYTMLDNLKLGYGGTKSEMERLLADATKLTGVKYDISNLGDVYDAINAVQGELGITGTTAKESAETFSGSLASMKGAFSNFMGNWSLGQDVGPSLNALAETVSTFLFNNFLPMLGNILKALPSAIATFIKEFTPYLLEAGKNLISSLSTGITQGLPNLLTSLETIVTNVTTLITENLPMFLEKGIEIIKNIANGILEAIPQIIESAGNILSNFISFIMKNLPAILLAGKDLLLSLVNGIINNLPAIVNSAIQAVSNFIDTLVANLPNIIATGAKFIVSLVSGIIERLPQLISTAITLKAKFVGMIISKLPDVLKAGIEILGSIVSGIVQVRYKLYDKGRELMDGLISKIKEKFAELKAKGQEIVTKITDGIDTKKQAAKNAINNVIQAIRDKINEWKTKFKTAGSNIVGSIADGIKGAIGKVKNAIGNVVQAIRNFLPFSPAKEGPLKDLNKLNFGGTISSSINSATKPVSNAMSNLAQDAMDSFNLTDGAMEIEAKTSISSDLVKVNAGLNYSLDRAMNLSQQVLIDEIQNLRAIVSRYLPIAAEQKTLVMNNGALVGSMLPEMNRQLGNDVDLRGRGR